MSKNLTDKPIEKSLQASVEYELRNRSESWGRQLSYVVNTVVVRYLGYALYSFCWPNTYALTISFTWLASISHVLQENGVVRMTHGQKNEHGWDKGLMCPYMSYKFKNMICFSWNYPFQSDISIFGGEMRGDARRLKKFYRPGDI